MLKKTLLLFLGLILIVGLFHNKKSLPDFVSYESPIYEVQSNEVHFFQDTTYVDDKGARHSDQEIFDEIFRMIDESQQYILLDLFFYSDFTGIETSSYRQLATELTQKLIKKKNENPDIVIQVITDPINIMYGGHSSKDFELLRENNISVTITNLKPLRDSNPIYSAFWRTAFQWFGNTATEGILPNPLDEKSPNLGIRTYLKMLNYKANHRKVVLTDYIKDDLVGFSTLITSANPHDGSSTHSNIAVRADSHVWQDILHTESAVVNFSNETFVYPPKEFLEKIDEIENGTLQVQILTEGKIEKRAIKEIDTTTSGDMIDIAMFYIADRDIVKALKRADKRGVHVRMLLDPNKDAFGREKNGIPNRQVAHELVQNSDGNTKIRWCDTHGEQCHNKLLLVKTGDQTVMMQGSANYTKRNLQDYNLETNIIITGRRDEQIFKDIEAFFETQWNNEEYIFYSTSYETYEDTSTYKNIVYRLKEFSGLSRW
ncbi:MAG: phosphatidylserine/phosphatidylglycerophosphate/cardiolipin synthase-like enzyme [Acidimicrobiales bacterium]|jgi:phosphatidylserine/phosphatidylglycerophosphate/cardiolipin synthase-like enzyme